MIYKAFDEVWVYENFISPLLEPVNVYAVAVAVNFVLFPHCVPPTETVKEEQEIGLVDVPDVKNLTITEARVKLERLGFKVICNSPLDPNSTLVVDQMPKYGVSLNANSVVCIYASNEDTRIKTQVPNIKDMTKEEALNSLKSKNLNIQVDGTTGVVVSQEPTYEAEVEEGTIVHVVIKEKLKDWWMQLIIIN